MIDTAIFKFGTSIILINNKPSFVISKKNFQAGWTESFSSFEIAMRSAYNCSSVITPCTRKQKPGKIITQYTYNRTLIAITTYINAKYTLVGFSKSLAVEPNPFDIQVNRISKAPTVINQKNHLTGSVIQVSAQTTTFEFNTLASNLSDNVTRINSPVCSGTVI